MTGKFTLVKIISTVHRLLYKMSGGLIGRRFGRLMFMLLTTTGRRSGLPRTVPLLYTKSSEGYILVGSFAGSPHDPDWVKNIRNDSSVEFDIGSARLNAVASIIEPWDSSYPALWCRATDVYPDFETYKKATRRPIPIVLIPHDVEVF